MSEPAVSLRFEVKIDGQDLGSFTGCDGLSAEYEVKEYPEGGQNGFVHRIPGRLKFTNIKLTRAVDDSSPALAAWFSSLQATVKRQTGQIVAYNGNKQPVATWALVGVYPVRWTGPTLSSDASGVATESLEISHDGFVG